MKCGLVNELMMTGWLPEVGEMRGCSATRSRFDDSVQSTDYTDHSVRSQEHTVYHCINKAYSYTTIHVTPPPPADCEYCIPERTHEAR